MRALRPAPVIIVLSTVLVILTAGSAMAQYSFDWSIPTQGEVKDMLILEDFITTFTNTFIIGLTGFTNRACQSSGSWSQPDPSFVSSYTVSQTVHIYAAI
jgi:hypothetical protein